MSIIQQNGGTILIRASQSSGDIEYYNNTNVWTPVLDGGWPLLITNTRTAYSQPVFKSYHDYMMYLQSKYK
jgi:hypothetical protein